MNLIKARLGVLKWKYRWARLWMGFRPSTYLAVMYLAIVIYQSVRDHLDLDNSFAWSKVKFNLLGTLDFSLLMS